MSAPKPPGPPVTDALAAIDAQLANAIPGLAVNPMADVTAQSIAQAMQQVEAATAAATGVPDRPVSGGIEDTAMGVAMAQIRCMPTVPRGQRH